MALSRFEWDDGDLVVRAKNGEAVRVEEPVAAQLLEYLSCGRIGDVEALVRVGASRARAEEMEKQGT